MSIVDEQLEYILDVFSGTDGGITYIKFRSMLKNIETQNNSASRKLLEMVDHFTKLLELAEKQGK